MASSSAAQTAGEESGSILHFKHHFTSANPGAISDHFKIDRKFIGEGSYGQVFKGTDVDTEVVRAIKSIDLSKIADPGRFNEEVAIQQRLDHPNIVRLFEVFKDAKRMYLVMELCHGGELFDRIVEQCEKHNGEYAFDERGGANYMQQILGAMHYLHSNDFVHRDIKPENFLLADKAKDAPIKVIDFGLAKRFKVGGKHEKTGEPLFMQTKAGTPYYVAPQVLMGNYDEKCDIWSCGVIAYILLCGYPPFYGDRDDEILRSVKAGVFDFPKEEWGNVSAEAKDMIKQMLTVKAEKRPSAEGLLGHRWLTDKTSAPTGTLVSNMATRLKNFTGVSKLKKVALTLIAKQMNEKDIDELKQTFILLDTNRDGTLTVKEITEGMIKHEIKLPASMQDLPETLKKLDTDGSGSIDYLEFLAATLSTKQYLKYEALWAAFRVFDKDGDGCITRQELEEVLQDDSEYSRLRAELMLKEADLNSDGVIDFEEFRAMMEEEEHAKAK